MNIKKRKVLQQKEFRAAATKNYDLLRHNIERQKSSPASSRYQVDRITLTHTQTHTVERLIEIEHTFYVP